MNGQEHYFAATIGSNGYIVGANPAEPALIKSQDLIQSINMTEYTGCDMVTAGEIRPLYVRVAPEWLDDPIWIGPHAGIVDSFNADELSDQLGVPRELARKIQEWDQEVQVTYRPDDPPASGIHDPQAEDEWRSRGRELTRELAKALGPQFTVVFQAFGPSEVIQEGITAD